MPLTTEIWLSEFTANSTTADTQNQTNVIQLENGNILVTWTSANNTGAGGNPGLDVVGQRFDPLGNTIGGEFVVNHTFTGDDEQSMDTAAHPDGGFIGVYEDVNGTGTSIRLVERGANGAYISTGQSVISDASAGYPNYSDPHIAISSATSALIIYTKETSAGASILAGRFYNPQTNGYGTEFSIGSTSAPNTDGDITVLDNGNYVVTSHFTYAGNDQIKYTVLQPNGSIVLSANVSEFHGSNPSVTALTGGGFVLTWEHNNPDSEIAFKIYDSAGLPTAIYSFAVVNGDASALNNKPIVVALNDGGFLIVYNDDNAGDIGVKVQRYNANASLIGTEFLATSADISDLSGTALADGRVALSWTVAGNIHMEILDVRDNVNPSPVYTGNWQVGTVGDDVFNVDFITEVVHGWAGDDTITENASSAHTGYYGDDGNDTIIAGSFIDNDLHDGGNGIDAIDWSNIEQKSLVFDLGLGTVTNGIESEVMIHFENLIGTIYDDTIIGSSGINILSGGFSNDIINGLGGNDILNGNQGSDTLNGGAGADQIFGGSGNDTIILDDGDNLSGFETYDGGAGTDRLLLNGGAGTVTADLRYENLISIEKLEFGTLDPVFGIAKRTVKLNAEQVGAGLSANATIIGNATANHTEALVIYMGAELSLDLSGLTFQNWGSQFITIYGDASSETIIGTSQQDSVYGNDGDDTLSGGANNDHLYGSGGNDVLNGDDGNDRLYGGVGQDSLFGGAGDDRLRIDFGDINFGAEMFDGGTGYDRLEIISSQTGSSNFDLRNHSFVSIESLNFLFTQPGTSQIVGLSFNAAQFGTGISLTAEIHGVDHVLESEQLLIYMDSETSLDLSGLQFFDWGDQGEGVNIWGDADSETIIGTDGDDVIVCGAGNDTISGGASNDELYGNNGNDVMHGGAGSDYITGQNGDDWLYGDADIDLIFGGAGVDRVFGGDGDDTIDGEAAADILHGNAGDDIINGGQGSDRMYGETGDDIMNGGDNNDSMFGHAGNDTLNGDAGNDVLWGYSGRDILNGGTGDDVMHGGQAADILHGDDGDDTLNGNYHADRLYGDAGNDILNGGAGYDALFGGDGDDTLNGDQAADNLWGLNGADILNGGSGNDILHGGAQQDVLNGGSGNDTLHGGGDTDTFVFADGFGIDTILDFAAANAEKIDLSGVAAITDFADLAANHLTTDIATGFAQVTDGANIFVLNNYTVADFGAGLAISNLDFVF